MNYGDAVKKARGIRGLSQRELAKEAGLDPSYVSLIETGRRAPSTKALESIADALGVPLYLLVFLGSDEDDLRGIDKASADALGRQLLEVVVAGG